MGSSTYRQFERFGKTIPEGRVILECEVGSTIHGVGIGADDFDTLGVFVETQRCSPLGLNPVDCVIERMKPAGERSGPGDVDRTLFGLRKFIRLALGGNPSVLLLLFSPGIILENSPLGSRLRDNRHLFISLRAGRAYLGYMDNQIGRWTGDQGQKRCNRPELIERYGFDTKYAMHALRLGIQGLSLVLTGAPAVPLPEEEARALVDLRHGETPEEKALARARDLRARLADAIDHNPMGLPPKGDSDAAERMMMKMYFSIWKKRR